MFGVSEPSRREKVKDNVLPVTVLASFVLAGIAAPFLPKWAGPLAIAQARKPRNSGETISDASQTQKIQRSNTVASSSTRARKDRSARIASGGGARKSPRTPGATPRPKPPRSSSGPRPTSERSNDRNLELSQRPPLMFLNSAEAIASTTSLPDTRAPRSISIPTTPTSNGNLQRPLDGVQRRSSHHSRPLAPATLSNAQKIRLLRSHYFRSETQFLTALEDISNRLVIVPKPARLSSLRAELALIAQDLPAEVDIPIICPANLVDGKPSRSKHHRIVRLSPAEATVLNSAEKVPYLLMVEVLRDDFDFDPESVSNVRLVTEIVSESSARRRRFDLSEAPREDSKEHTSDVGVDSVFEPVSGDLGSSALIQDVDEQTPRASVEPTMKNLGTSVASQTPRLSNGTDSLTVSSIATPRTSDTSNPRSSSPNPLRKMTLPANARIQAPDQPDFSALATHMRTAAHMLAQLDSSSSKRPRDEVAAIKAKIIASMQSLEEQNFATDEHANGPTFDTIINTKDPSVADASADLELQSPTDPDQANGAGAARMENDQKTGGVQRRGDRDDPSAATFGEEWAVKKERIRKSSPYGWMKNWDLLSVIVKTGADLRQEAFACQLIQVCWKIWTDADVPVWVKRMRILVTGESSGLIETITNGVSLHSLKRSLTLATISSGKNPRSRIATLRDHFIKTFGEPDTDTYKEAEDAFMRSLAAYSIISYILQLKDRHNGNVLIDSHGHIIHIDFGFMLSNSPGSVGFEAAPFKLTQDYVDVLGGVDSERFGDFKKLCKQAFQGKRNVYGLYLSS